MAHHGISPFDGGQSLENFHDQFKTPKLGATHRFPEGKLIISFGDKPISWVGLTKEQAKDFAQLLIKRASQ